MAADITSSLHNPGDNLEHGQHDKTEDMPFSKTHGFTKCQRDIAGIDPILTALTQLGAFKVGCHGAFTALFDGDIPRIIAERATQPPAVGKQCLEPGEAQSFIGLATLGLRCNNGNEASADSIFDGHRVIRDTGGESTSIQKHHLIQRSRARFYAEIPLRDVSGSLIGTYVVLDQDCHPSFGSSDLATLYSIAGSITTHLDNVWVRQRDAHDQRRLNALLELAEGNNGLKFRKDSRTSTSSESPLSIIPAARPVHPHIASVYKRASSLLQSALDADGVIFMNAPRMDSSRSSRSSRTGSGDSGVSVGSADTSRRTSSGMCDLLGSAFSKSYSANGCMTASGIMDEDLLQKLVLEFPQGTIVNSTPGASSAVEPILNADAGATTTRGRLSTVFPDVSSLIFLPLWKCDKTKCLAGVIVWTCDPYRTFNDNTLHYLKAAGNMVVFKITQAEHSALEKSNFDPLSSINHELRSPLHGVLANAELLQSTNLDSAQRDMVKTVGTCGEMLLNLLNDLGGPNKPIQVAKGPTQWPPITKPCSTVSPMSGRISSDASAFKVSDKLDGRALQPAVSNRVCFEEALSPKTQRLGRTLHVLIVDDNNINLKVLSTFLHKTGCTFETASDGLSALQIYERASRNFDYVLMDISMPVMDGITASKEIRLFEEENNRQRSTIMAVTSITSSETQAQAFTAGIDGYLIKPLSLWDLKRILHEDN